MSDSLRPHELQHARLPCPSLCSWVRSNSCLLSQWRHPTISSSVTPFSSSSQSFPASESFPINESAFHIREAKVLALQHQSSQWMNYQGWFPLGLTGMISLLSKELSRVFSSTTIQKHHFFGAQPSLWYSHICTWILEKP